MNEVKGKCFKCNGKGEYNLENRRWSYLSKITYTNVTCDVCHGTREVKLD